MKEGTGTANLTAVAVALFDLTWQLLKPRGELSDDKLEVSNVELV